MLSRTLPLTRLSTRTLSPLTSLTLLPSTKTTPITSSRNRNLSTSTITNAPPPTLAPDVLTHSPTPSPNPKQSNKQTALAFDKNDSYLSKILNAKVYDVAVETQLQEAHNLSALVHNKVYLKREDTQPVFSFKLRGAYNKMASLTQAELDLGVVACSAGNHAQGVALSAKRLNCRAVIVMPIATPAIKVNSVMLHGGETVTVKLFGNNFDEAAGEAKRLVQEENLTMIHPFDDPLVIAGQGTIGMEILKQSVSKPLDAIFVCTGGGGMLAGIAAYVKRVRPGVKVIGVEADDAAGMTRSLEAGRVLTLSTVGLFADGAAVRTVGNETFRICEALVDEMVTVNTDQICEAIKLSYNDARVVLEPAGALAVAGMKKYIDENKIAGSSFVCITSGANMDFDRLRFVSERADTSEKMLSITIPESPGAFRQLYSIIHPRNVTEFSYRFDDNDKDANVFMSFQPLKTIPNDFDNVVDLLRTSNYKTSDLSTNELAKVHGRYLAGGRANAKHERLFRFIFPENPGALQRFLKTLETTWNVSLFHYRNHGDDFGRVLVGIQIPEGEVDGEEEEVRVQKFLVSLGYDFVEETTNLVYEDFLDGGGLGKKKKE